MTETKQKQKNLGDILMESGIVSEAEIKEALRRQHTTGRRLGVELTEMGLCTTEDVERALAIQFSMPFVRLTPGQVDKEAAVLISAELATEGVLVPTWSVGETVHVVMADPTNQEIVDRLLAETGGQVQISLGVPSEIRQAIRVVYGSEPAGPAPSARFESSIFTPNEIEAVNKDDSGRTFLHALLAKASAASCRGILLEPTRGGGGRVRFRSVSDWRTVATCSRDWYLEIEAQLERLGRVETRSENLLKEGRLPSRDYGGGELVRVWESTFGRVALVTPAIEAAGRRAAEFADPPRAMTTLISGDGVIVVNSSAMAVQLAGECLVSALTSDGHTVLVARSDLKRLPETGDSGAVVRFPSPDGRLCEDWQRCRDLPFDWIFFGNEDDANPVRPALDLCLRRKRLATSIAGASVSAVARRLMNSDIETEQALPELTLLHVVAVPILCRGCRQQITVPPAVLSACRLDDNSPVYAAGGCPDCQGTGLTGERILGEAVRLTDVINSDSVGELASSVSGWLRALLTSGEVALADYMDLTGAGVSTQPTHLQQ